MKSSWLEANSWRRGRVSLVMERILKHHFLKKSWILGNPAGWEEPLEVRVGLKAGPAQLRLLKSCSIVNNSMDGDSRVAI